MPRKGLIRYLIVNQNDKNQYWNAQKRTWVKKKDATGYRDMSQIKDIPPKGKVHFLYRQKPKKIT